MNISSQLPIQQQEQDIFFSIWIENLQQHQLDVTAFAAEEAVFGTTRVEIMLVSRSADIDLRIIMDTRATLTVCHKYMRKLRHFSGIVTEAERGNEGHHLTAYRLVLMSSLHRLDYSSDCRIFQNICVPDIVKTVLAEQGIENVAWHISEKHLPREFCVQYRESHLVFIQRIMAEEGIFYYFEHTKEGGEKLIICDKPRFVCDCSGRCIVEYNGMASGAMKGIYCSSLIFREKLASTGFTQRDYTFKNPAHVQEHRHHHACAGSEKRNYELFDYPGRYKQDETGISFTRHKLEAARVDSAIACGIANAPFLKAGNSFHLTCHPHSELNRHWRLLTIRHEGTQPQAFGKDAQASHRARPVIKPPALAAFAGAGLDFDRSRTSEPSFMHPFMQNITLFSNNSPEKGKESDATQYACVFYAMPASDPYRPPQHKKPLVEGPHIANVVGPQDEEIHTDEYGRVKVHFPWDRHTQTTAENASCWIRVVSGWAGMQWGSVSIPRIGQEVLVDFLEGDPDQPIITGRTYHAVNRPPYRLPEHKTKMVIRSNTHKGEGFNEISFEDQAHVQNMFIHAQKDQTIKVLNNCARRIEANEIESVGGNHSQEVAHNVQQTIGGSINRFIGSATSGLAAHLAPLLARGSADMESGSQAVGLPLLGAFAKSLASTTLTGEKAALGAHHAFNMAKDHLRAGGQSMASAGAHLGEMLSSVMPVSGVANSIVEKFQTDTIGLARTEQVGSYKNTSVGHTMTINVGEEFIIRVGKSLIVMDQSGNITVKGTKLNFAADGPVQINGKVIDLN